MGKEAKKKIICYAKIAYEIENIVIREVNES